jgi:hypothetical protein
MFKGIKCRCFQPAARHHAVKALQGFVLQIPFSLKAISDLVLFHRFIDY